MSVSPNKKYVLYAEDDADDQLMMREVLSDIDSEVELVVCDNGKDAVVFLENLSPNDFLPCLIVLDLNMPIWDGLQTLLALKSNSRFIHIPVLIFSTTSDQRDRDVALEAGAVAFVTKPTSYRELETIVRSFTTYFVS